MASYSGAYSTINDMRATSRWYQHIRLGNSQPRHVDVAQLVKHFLGLSREFPNHLTVLLYFYWGPENWRDIAECLEHRAELQRLSYSLAADPVRFASLSYPELWDRWKARGILDAGMSEALRQRYLVGI